VQSDTQEKKQFFIGSPSTFIVLFWSIMVRNKRYVLLDFVMVNIELFGFSIEMMFIFKKCQKCHAPMVQIDLLIKGNLWSERKNLRVVGSLFFNCVTMTTSNNLMTTSYNMSYICSGKWFFLISMFSNVLLYDLIIFVIQSDFVNKGQFWTFRTIHWNEVRFQKKSKMSCPNGVHWFVNKGKSVKRERKPVQ